MPKAKKIRRRRKKHLESLRGREAALWSNVQQHIGTRLPTGYDQAVSLLRDLRDLAMMRGCASDFRMKMNALCAEHARKTALLRRLREAMLTD